MGWATRGTNNISECLGGYVEGRLSILTTTTLYLFVGCQGSFSNKNPLGGYNGGGDGHIGDHGLVAGGGGGATDIRLR